MNEQTDKQANTYTNAHADEQSNDITRYLIDETLDIPINIGKVRSTITSNIRPTITSTVSVGDGDFEVVTKVPPSEHDIKVIMELIADRPRPLPKKSPTLIDKLPSMTAIAMTSKELANKLPYAKEVKGYVKDVVREYLPPAKDMWSKLKKGIKAPMKIYNNYRNSFTYSNEVDYD